MNAVDLARTQFALTANIHFLFVVLTLGLAPLVAVMQTRHVLTGREVHARMTRFWGQIYVVNYGLGIVTGLVMEFQFGLDWTGVSRVAGQVFGAPLTLETIVAFFAEATFLGMWIFGWNILPRAVHLALFYVVTLAAFASAYVIMVANGFLQHPVGYAMSGGGAHITDVAALLTNPGALAALRHLIPAALLTGGIVVTGVSCWQLRHGDEPDLFLRSLRLGVLVAVLGAGLTIHYGFAQFDYVGIAQPLKFHAVLNGEPTTQLQHQMANRYGPGRYTPPGWLHTAFLVMQYVGFGSGGLGVLLLPTIVGRWILRHRVVLRVMPWIIPAPFVAVVCGWLVREIGRQPWVIYGVLRTPAAFAGVGAAQVAFSLALFGAVVVALAVTDWLVLARLARRGPTGMVLGTTFAERHEDHPSAESTLDLGLTQTG